MQICTNTKASKQNHTQQNGVNVLTDKLLFMVRAVDGSAKPQNRCYLSLSLPPPLLLLLLLSLSIFHNLSPFSSSISIYFTHLSISSFIFLLSHHQKFSLFIIRYVRGGGGFIPFLPLLMIGLGAYRIETASHNMNKLRYTDVLSVTVDY